MSWPADEVDNDCLYVACYAGCGKMPQIRETQGGTMAFDTQRD